jgi:hypothetical protein
MSQVSGPKAFHRVYRTWRLGLFALPGRPGNGQPGACSNVGKWRSARKVAVRQCALGVSAQNEKVSAVNDFFGIVAAGPAFFVSSWLLMLFAGITASDVGIRPFGYITSMVVTIGLWLVIAPAVGAIARTGKKKA